MFRQLWMGLLVSCVFAGSAQAASVKLSAHTTSTTGFLFDVQQLTLVAPSQFHITGTFANIAGPELNISQKGSDGAGDWYTFTTSPIDFHTPVTFGPGSYLFTAQAYPDSTTSSGNPAGFDVTISAIPLPAAAWLFGSAILGFAAFSTSSRRV